MIIAAIIIAALLLFVFIVAGRPANRARKAFSQADALLRQAESAMIRAEYGLAAMRYREALRPARESGCALFQAEAYYGLARVFEKQGQLSAARVSLEKALANRQEWEGEKPNFAALISNMLKDVNRRLPR
jgi:tetratricopeptide (TPR) repeat protein